MATLNVTFKDYSREMSTVAVNVAEASAGGADYDALVAKLAGFIGVLDDLSIGVVAKESITIAADKEVGDATAGAKRELGLRVFWSDTTAETQGHFTIPCPDPTGAWLQVGTDEVDYADADVAAFVTWAEANILSPDGNAIEVSKIMEVGRRN